MTRLRVLFVLGTLRAGGTERQVVEILKHLARDRFAPVLYVIYREGELLDEVPEDVEVISYWDQHCYPRWNYPGRIFRAQARDIALTIRDKQIDLLYDRTSHMSLVASVAAQWSPVKRISTVVADPRREFASSHPRFGGVKRWMLRRAYHRADRVIAVSDGVREGLVEFFGLAAHRVSTCYNLFDIDRLDRLARVAGPEFPKDRFHVVSIGRLQREKGHRFLLGALYELVHHRGLSQVMMWFIGHGPEEAALRRQAVDRGLADHVRWEGYQPNPMPYLRQAQLFCLPSLFEGMPNALVEAMIAGVPVLASDCQSGPREVLQGGELGRLVAPGDATSLANEIEDAVRNHSAWQAKTARARQHAQDAFSMETGLRRLQELFLEVASRA